MARESDTTLAARRDRLEALRTHRAPRERARGLSDDCARLLRSLTRVSAEHEDAQRAWGGAAPPDLAALAWVADARRGRITIGAESAAARHRIERWLRADGLDAMRDAASGPVRSVRVRIEPRD